MSTLSALASGFALQGALIVAIGAQNAFVLRQGLRREHVGAVVAFCAAADVILTAAGVAGVGAALGQAPGLARALALGGAAFLLWSGVGALRRALRPGALAASGGVAPSPLGAVLAKTAGFTLLNPHVYIDTVLLAGTVGATIAGAERMAFVAGAGSASLLWFAGLGYGARLLAPLFARPAAWRWFDGAVAVLMLVLAAGLASHATAWSSAQLIEPAAVGLAAVMGLGDADVVQRVGVGRVAQHRLGDLLDLREPAEFVARRQELRGARRPPPDRDLVEHRVEGLRRIAAVNDMSLF